LETAKIARHLKKEKNKRLTINEYYDYELKTRLFALWEKMTISGTITQAVAAK